MSNPVDKPLTFSSSQLEDECMLEGNGIISQLEERKSILEKDWNNQIAQIVDIFQQLHKELDIRRTKLLEELSQLYQKLMAPIQECIKKLEKTVAYTGYVGMLGKYSLVTEIKDKQEDKIRDISLFLSNIVTPSDPYRVDVPLQDIQTIRSSIKAYTTLIKVEKFHSDSVIPHTVPRLDKYSSHRLKKFTCAKHITPIDVAYHPTTNIYFVLFDNHWKTYQKLHISLVERERVDMEYPNLISMNSSIALISDSVFIMANHDVYVYSNKGKYIKQLNIQKYIGSNLSYPKLYTFPGINSMYIGSLQSSEVFQVNPLNGTEERNINLASNCENLKVPKTLKTFDSVPSIEDDNRYIKLVDIGISVLKDQLLILHSLCSNSTKEPCQMYIQAYNINNLQYHSSYSLSHNVSPFCCLAAHYDTLYVLDVSTGASHLYSFSEMRNKPQPKAQKKVQPYSFQYPPLGYNRYEEESKKYSWQRKSVTKNSVPLSTEVDCAIHESKVIRAFFNKHPKKQVVLFYGETMHFLS